MNKLLKKTATSLLSLAVMVMMFGVITAAAAPSVAPFATEDLEKATGEFKLVRDTDRIPDTLTGAELFAFPYEGGDKQLKIAKKSDSATSKYVIEGNQSLYFTNVGSNAQASVSPLITKGNVGTALNFSPDKVYVARFLFKEIADFSPSSTLTVTVRTWSESDPWVDFEIKPKSAGGFSAKVTSNGRTYDKVSIQQVEEDVYEVALRFSGLLPSADKYCYLFWMLTGEGGVSIDGFKVYESKSNPNTFFERTAYGSGDPAPAQTTAATQTAKPAQTTKTEGTTKAPVNNNTTGRTQPGATSGTTQTAADPDSPAVSEPSSATDETGGLDPEETEADLPGETEGPTEPSAEETTPTTGEETVAADAPQPQEGDGLSDLALGLLVAAGVVVIGSIAAVVVFLVIKKKNGNA